jgi:hypothetical protein
MSLGTIVGPDGRPTTGSIDLHNHTITLVDQSTGQLVKMDLSPTDVHVPTTLPMYAAGYKLQDAIADQMAPAVVVPKASDYFPTWDKDNAFQRPQSAVAGPGGELPEVSTKLSSTQFTTTQYVLASFVPTEVEANADGVLRPMMKAMSRIMMGHKLLREDRVAALLQTSGNWDSSVVLALGAGQNWNGGASSDPIANVNYIQEHSLQKVTGWGMNRRVWNAFSRNSQVQKFVQFKSDVPGVFKPEQIGGGTAILSLPGNIYVSDMKGKTTSGTYDYVWGDSVVFLTETMGAPADQESIATAKTFRWSGVQGAVPGAITPTSEGPIFQGWVVRSFYDPKRGGRGGNWVVATVNDSETMTGNIVGGFISGVIV